MDPQTEELLNIIRSLSARCAALAREKVEQAAAYEAKIAAIRRPEAQEEAA